MQIPHFPGHELWEDGISFSPSLWGQGGCRRWGIPVCPFAVHTVGVECLSGSS